MITPSYASVSHSRPDQPHVLQNDLAQGLRATETLQRIQNLNAGQSAFCIIIGRKPFRQVLGRHRGRRNSQVCVLASSIS